MNQNIPTPARSRVLALCLAAVCVSLVIVQGGCTKDDSANRYTPSSAVARDALDKALTAWQQGADPDEAASDAKPAIRMVDGSRKAGQKLASYEITSEAAGETPSRFSVRLRLDNPNRELEANYVVVGNDPIWVFREEEYTRQQGM